MKLGFRELIFFSVMVGLLACTYFFVFAKVNAKRQELLADTQAKQLALSNLKQSTAGIGDLNRKIEELQKAINFFDSKLPQQREVDRVLKEVSQLMTANGLTAKTFRTTRSDKTASYCEQPIQMSLSGDFNGFYTFLLQLEKLPRLTRVTQMKLEKISERDGETNAQLTISIFFEPDATGDAAASAR